MNNILPVQTEVVKYISWNGKELIAAPLHEVPHLLLDCCQLINMEWKRSETARMRSIKNSSDKFPASLVLIDKDSVIGHAKLSIIPVSEPSVMIESVVIHPDLRGCGLGRIIMNYSEEFAKQKGIQVMYLSTDGQEKFYEKLNYIICPPINIYGNPLGFQVDDASQNEENDANKSEKRTDQATSTKKNLPPPPPPMPIYIPKNPPTPLYSRKTFMKKYLL